MHTSEVSPAAIRRNTGLFIAGEALWGFQMALVGTATVMTVLLREYGATKTMIGAISSIDAFGLLLPQTIGLFLFASVDTRKRDIIIWHFVGIIPFLFAIAVLAGAAPRVPAMLVVWGVLLCYGLHVSGIGVVAGVWSDWIAHLFPVRWRGRAMGWSWGASSLAGIAAALAAGALLRRHHSHLSYAVLYGVAGCIAALSILTFCGVADHGRSDGVCVPRLRVLEAVRYSMASLRHANFRAFIAGRVLATAGFCIVPLIAVYYLSDDGGALSNATLVSLGAMMSVGVALGNVAAGMLGDRHGHRAGMLLSIALQVCALLLLLATRGVVSCGAVYCLAGACLGMTNIAHSNILFETCPHDNRLAHITTGNIVLGLCATPLPLLAGRMAHVYGLRVVFGISLMCSVAALAWMARYLREPRAAR